MTFNITRRRNGHHMVTVQVKHQVARETVIDTIITELWNEGTPAEDQNEYSRAAVEKVVRDAYFFHGNEWDISAGDTRQELDEEEREEAQAWAEAEVTRLWPEWRK